MNPQVHPPLLPDWIPAQMHCQVPLSIQPKVMQASPHFPREFLVTATLALEVLVLQLQQVMLQLNVALLLLLPKHPGAQVALAWDSQLGVSAQEIQSIFETAQLWIVWYSPSSQGSFPPLLVQDSLGFHSQIPDFSEQEYTEPDSEPACSSCSR